MKIEIDFDKCIGIGSCEAVLPEVFEVSDSGQVVVLEPEPGADDHDKVEAAAAACPTGAISLS
ncbi:MAG: ferredoxin [Actinomycetota bacterium]